MRPPTPVNTLLFFFNDTATTEIYTLSLHDALPISHRVPRQTGRGGDRDHRRCERTRDHARSERHHREAGDRKSTRLNSSHVRISYAVFCLKKKKLDAIAIQLALEEPRRTHAA